MSDGGGVKHSLLHSCFALGYLDEANPADRFVRPNGPNVPTMCDTELARRRRPLLRANFLVSKKVLQSRDKRQASYYYISNMSTYV